MSKNQLTPSKYRLLGIIGQGQFGRVFCGVQRQTGEIVALKELPQSTLSTKKFLRELRILLTLNHPNIVTCQEIEHSRRGRYLIMDYCEAGTLRDLINSEREIALLQKIKLVKDILLGISQVHQQGIIHRDLKPENILLNLKADGWLARISDFGISILPEELGQKTTRMGDTGSPAYMAPEQFYGKYSPASDIYAIGIILFELLTGKRPFFGNPKEIMYAHINQHIDIPESLPVILKSTLNTALQKLPQHRFKNAEEMINVLDLAKELIPTIHLEKKSFFATNPSSKTASLLEIIQEITISEIIRKMVVNPNNIYLASHDKLYCIAYTQSLFLEIKELIISQRKTEILDLKSRGKYCIAMTKENESCYYNLLYADHIFNKKNYQYQNLITSNDTNNSWFATANESSLHIWNVPELSEQINPNVIMPIHHLLSMDNLHGIAFGEDTINNQTPVFLFNRRAILVKAFSLPITLKTISNNTKYTFLAIEKTSQTSENIGLIIQVKPLKIKRLSLEINPDYIISQDWGYILANHQGDILILNHQGDCLNKYQLNLGKITAMAALPKDRIVIATWQDNHTRLFYGKIRLKNLALNFNLYNNCTSTN